MRNVTRSTLLLACLTCFVAGWLSGNGNPTNLLAEPLPKKVDANPFPMTARLGGNLYLQTSGEYRACCHGIYQCAELRLESTLAKANPKPVNPAIVMDLDETVLDNSAFETFLYQNGLEYSDTLWADYEENHPQDVTLIPGAKHFIQRAEELGVTAIYLSNRSDKFKKATASALKSNGIKTDEAQFYLKTKDDTTDKSSRREAVAAKYHVLMYFGDQLRDFSEAYLAPKLAKNATPEECLQAINQRAALVDLADGHWGVDWFVLPNPVYGEWEKLIGPDPLAILHPTSMKKLTPATK